MSKSAYLSEISPWWTIERQEAALADVLPGAIVYRDLLDTRARRRHQATDLVKRFAMLRPTTRGAKSETVYVASLAVLAWAEDDMRAVLAELAARGSALVSIDDGPVEDVIAGWKHARTKSRLAGASLLGAAISAERRKSASVAAVDRIKDRWKLPTKEQPTLPLLAEASVSRNTVRAVLGFTREEYQARYQAGIKRRVRKETQKT